MKKILYIFLTLSILSTGCSKEDDVQLTQETFSHLDEELFGVWKDNLESNEWLDYYRSFSSNGRWTAWSEDIDYRNQGIFYVHHETGGTWWVEEDKIFTYYDDDNVQGVWEYSVSGNSLLINGVPWVKE